MTREQSGGKTECKEQEIDDISIPQISDPFVAKSTTTVAARDTNTLQRVRSEAEAILGFSTPFASFSRHNRKLLNGGLSGGASTWATSI
jgi:hypothetical protein